eukprot:6182979-Pleurochrysis_carterae.AAC.4
MSLNRCALFSRGVLLFGFPLTYALALPYVESCKFVLAWTPPRTLCSSALLLFSPFVFACELNAARCRNVAAHSPSLLSSARLRLARSHS